MKKCISCENEQDTGKFCGKCGGEVVVSINGNAESSAELSTSNVAGNLNVPHTTNASSNERVEKVKEHSKMFWNYFVRYIKRPSESFVTGTSEFINALISILIFAIIFGITIYVSISSFVQAALDGLGGLGEFFIGEIESPPFFSIFGSAFLFAIVSMGLVFLALFTVTKFFGPSKTWQELLSYYGAYMLLSSLVGLIGLILFLLNIYVIGSVIVILSFLIMLAIIPTYIINKLLELKSQKLDKFHGYLVYILLFSFVYWIYIKIIADSTIAPMIEQLRSL
ncbi:DUF6574 domain-containing protein [Psychrobacillus sp. MER TA 171]|uniref:DUF6574 domain-containing protein n=1 Tax=Psychrobacillus sp. MER TA 171 TaxID=2939577 RepID=UPI00203A5C07|nr:DUF6574 domain-containing protein [Psychrobacillus sp. MER TA 171]MCM3356500.1 hypothetical protein [Psychrobacillus sp. MER TA 171]